MFQKLFYLKCIIILLPYNYTFEVKIPLSCSFVLRIKFRDFQINEALFWITMNLRYAIVLIHVYYYPIQVISVLSSKKSEEFVISSLFWISISTQSHKSARWLSIVETSNRAIRWRIYHAATLLKTGLCCAPCPALHYIKILSLNSRFLQLQQGCM